MDDPVKKAELKNQYGNTLFRLEQYANAIHPYTIAIQICPQIAKYYGNRSACYLMMNEFIKALADSRKSIELDPGYKKGYIRIGKCCLANGDMRYGEHILAKAKGIFPEDNEILDMYEDMKCVQENIFQYETKMENKQYEEALKRIDKCLEKAPNCVKYLTNKGKCLIYLQRFEEAENLADEVLKYKPTDEDALYIKETARIYQEDSEKAFELSKKLKKILPDHSGTSQLFRNTTIIQKFDQQIKNAIKDNNYTLAYELIGKTIKVDDTRKFLNKRLYKQKINIAAKDKKLYWNAVDDCTNYMLIYEKDKEILKARAKFYMDLEEYEDAVEDYKELGTFENSNEIKKLLEKAEKLLEDQLKHDHKILKIKARATKEEIKSAAMELIKRYHPDKNRNATPERKKMLEKKVIRIRTVQKRLLDKAK